MRITLSDLKDQIISLEIDGEEPVTTLQLLVQIETGILAKDQLLKCNGKILTDNQKIKTNIKDQDMLIVEKKIDISNINFSNVLRGFGQNAVSNNNNNFNRNNNNNTNMNPFLNLFNNNPLQNPMLLQEARKIRQHYENSPQDLNYILNQNRPLAEAILSSNPNDLLMYLHRRQMQINRAQMEENRRMQELESDPMNPQKQQEIQKMILQNQLDQNLQQAQEYHPEVFGRISMLYIELSINKTPIQAFVDSGAQSTIMSVACAQRCGITRFIDKRFAGMALGVGTARIIGQIFNCSIQVLDKHLPTSFTVMEDDKLDFLLGLDMLRRFQCCINLRDNNLSFVVDGKPIFVSFLPEQDIHQYVSISHEQKMLDQQDEQEQKSNSTNKPSGSGTNKPGFVPVTSNTAPTQNNRGYKQEDIKKLLDLGATRPEAIQALTIANGNLELAAGIIHQKFYG